MKIPFMLPDITETEIDEVVDTLRSSWITTGEKTKKLEKQITKFCNSGMTVCLNSCTAALSLTLKTLGIEQGDEIITSPYTFASTINEIIHSGAKPVFIDIKDDFNLDPRLLEKALSEKTKAVIPTDIAGFPCDYDEIKQILEDNKNVYRPGTNILQQAFDRPIIISDSAHAFGAFYKNKPIGSVADFTLFSFHATKNITTAEGGAVTFNEIPGINIEDLYNYFMMLSLHGQNKDSYTKLKIGEWHYSIEFAGYKCNMPDLCSSIGLAQLSRYNEIIEKRKKLCELYSDKLNNDLIIIPQQLSNDKISSYHLFLTRIRNANEDQRNKIINKMAEYEIACNVHFIPIVMHPYYKKQGFDIKNYPVTYEMYKNEISLPLYSTMTYEQAEYVCDKYNKCVRDYR